MNKAFAWARWRLAAGRLLAAAAALMVAAGWGQTTNAPGTAPVPGTALVTNAPGTLVVPGTVVTTNAPGQSGFGAPVSRYAYPLLDTNGAVIWPTDFWTVNAASAGLIGALAVESNHLSTAGGKLQLQPGGTLPPMNAAALTNITASNAIVAGTIGTNLMDAEAYAAFTAAGSGFGRVITNSLVVGSNTVVDAEAFGASPSAAPLANGLAISNALAYVVTNNITGILRFGSGVYDVHGHFVLPESGGRPNVYDQPGLLILGTGNTVLRQADTNAANGPFWRGGANWQDIRIEGPGTQYACTGLVQSLPGNNVFLRTHWSRWGGYAMLFDDCTFVVHYDTRLEYNRIGYGAGYKHDGVWFLGRADNNWTGIEIGAKGPSGKIGPSANGYWHVVGNNNTNAIIVVGGTGTSGQVIEIYAEHTNAGGTNGYVHLGHDPAVWPADVVESGSGIISVRVQNSAMQAKPGNSFIRPFTTVQYLALDCVRTESDGPLVDFAHPSANIVYLDARHVNVGSGPTFTWYGTESISRPTFRWGIGASTAHYDYTANRSTFPFSSMTYYAGRRGAFDYAWVSGADYDGSATRYASMTLTNWGGSATNYVLDMRDINIQQTYPMNRWASNYVGSIVFGGSIATAPVVITSSRSAVDTDSTVYLNAGSLTYTLPNASARPGRIIGVKLIASGTGTVDTTASQTIDGAASYALSAQYQYVVVQAVSGAWYIMSRGP